uniref:Uncharacterized protein n=1 Tax=uncultured Desulfobacterium sp. TaxID=201089 RepID=E1Y8P7_9BACT|nr:unknown protein [uncultured Desulfobacterium sp.]
MQNIAASANEKSCLRDLLKLRVFPVYQDIFTGLSGFFTNCNLMNFYPLFNESIR